MGLRRSEYVYRKDIGKRESLCGYFGNAGWSVKRICFLGSPVTFLCVLFLSAAMDYNRGAGGFKACRKRNGGNGKGNDAYESDRETPFSHK